MISGGVVPGGIEFAFAHMICADSVDMGPWRNMVAANHRLAGSGRGANNRDVRSVIPSYLVCLSARLIRTDPAPAC